MNTLERRAFLKLLLAAPAGLLLSELMHKPQAAQASRPNIVVVVMDALTARNMSLYGYRRWTTPNIERFAARADVYHAHHSGGTFTTAGTASLLTGTYPWTHRAINLKGLVARDRYKRNVFNLFGTDYQRAGFTQNYYASYLLSQFSEDIDRLYPMESFGGKRLYVVGMDQKDYPSKFRAFDDFLFSTTETASTGSLVLGTIHEYAKESSFKSAEPQYFESYRDDLLFNINTVYAGIAAQAGSGKSPSFSYFHLFPPHDPYAPEPGFRHLFGDGWLPPIKSKPAVQTGFSKNMPGRLNQARLQYDQYLATADAAFGKFLDQITSTGLLDTSYLILTADHGESFERGYLGHAGPYVYEPSIHIPLLVSSPGQRVRRDFYSPTNSVDVLPTLLKISGLEIPGWLEGEVLPGQGGVVNELRATFSMDAKGASAFGSLVPITVAMRRGDYKMIWYRGYEQQRSVTNDIFELYNVAQDAQEMHDRIGKEVDVAQQMKEILLETYNTASQPLRYGS